MPKLAGPRVKPELLANSAHGVDIALLIREHLLAILRGDIVQVQVEREARRFEREQVERRTAVQREVAAQPGCSPSASSTRASLSTFSTASSANTNDLPFSTIEPPVHDVRTLG